MLTFYRNAAITVLALTLLTALFIYSGIIKSRLAVPLFPTRDNDFLWAPAIEPPVPVDETRLTVKSEVGTIDYEFFLDPDAEFPYTHYSLYFIKPDQPYRLVDLTAFSGVTFKISCDPKNVLLMVLFSFDEKVTSLFDQNTRRVSSTAFSCDTHWTTVTIDFDELDTPHWWLNRNNFPLSDQGYQLNKTMALAFVNSLQSPINTLSHVRLTDITLVGNEPSYIYAAIIASAFAWVLFFLRLFRQYLSVFTERLKKKVILDQPLIAYKKLSIEPQKDKEKSAVLRFMATEYANPDLSLETATSSLSINRTKINDILKEELGLTFTAYLNKLRLTEAARLLAENEDANVSEIAYLVGYNNVSYFNKLFKLEYDCTPKIFKTLYRARDIE